MICIEKGNISIPVVFQANLQLSSWHLWHCPICLQDSGLPILGTVREQLHQQDWQVQYHRSSLWQSYHTSPREWRDQDSMLVMINVLNNFKYPIAFRINNSNKKQTIWIFVTASSTFLFSERKAISSRRLVSH